LVTDQQRALAILAGLPETDRWRTAPQISNALRDDFGIRLHWRSIAHAFDGDRDMVARRKSSGKWLYSIMQAGRDSIVKRDESITLVDPAKAISAVLTLHEVFGKLQGRIRVCDPYCDSVTIEHLDACPAASPIDLLTKNITDDATFRRVVAAARQKRLVEIRRASAPLHDRYLIHRNGLLIIGTSLNSFAKSQTFMTKAGQDIARVVNEAYDALWKGASTWT